MLGSAIQTIQSRLRREGFANEQAVSQGVVLKLLHELGWDVFNSRAVWPEYSVGTRRVDYALCHPEGRPAVFIEVKQVGAIEGADQQLFEYAYLEGIPLAVLTDGQRWNFYLPSGQGTLGDRRVYSLDLLERDLPEIELRLQRYLAFSHVKSGEALAHANEDYKDRSREREIERTLPKAWKDLLLDADEWLVVRLVDKVEALTGFKPTIEKVTDYLRGEAAGSSKTVAPMNARAAETVRRGREPQVLPVDTQPGGGTWYQLRGQMHQQRNGVELMVAILRDLTTSDPAFLERFAAREHGRNRRWVAQDKYELYQRRDLCDEYSRELVSGWWVGTNYSNSNKRQIIEAAIETAGLVLNRDFSYRLD